MDLNVITLRCVRKQSARALGLQYMCGSSLSETMLNASFSFGREDCSTSVKASQYMYESNLEAGVRRRSAERGREDV